MKNQVIPVYNFPNNSYNISIEMGKKNKMLNLFYSYNIPAGYWTLSIRDTDLKTIVGNLPLLSGHNLLEGLDYLELGELFLFRNSELTPEVPNNKNISTKYVLVWRA